MKLNNLRLDIHDDPKHGNAFFNWSYGDPLDELIRASNWLNTYIEVIQQPAVRAASATSPILHD